jgi:predicted nucleotidyltransferase
MAPDTNLARLERLCFKLGALSEQMVLIGGTAAGLLITDAAADPVRPTIDVDMIVEAATWIEYERLARELRSLGFAQPGIHGDPICRWRSGTDVLDLMPIDDRVLGFSNRWYRTAFNSAIRYTLPSGTQIRHIDGPHFLATKLEAYSTRGHSDPVTSHDVEDLVRLVDGRPSLLEECRDSAEALRAAVARGLLPILEDRLFTEALAGYFGRDGTGRATRVLRRLREFSGFA